MPGVHTKGVDLTPGNLLCRVRFVKKKKQRWYLEWGMSFFKCYCKNVDSVIHIQINSKNTVDNGLNWIKIAHNIAFSSDKDILSESEEKYAQTKHRLYTKTVLSKYVGG